MKLQFFDHNIVYVNTIFDTFIDGLDTVQSSPNPIESLFKSLNLLKCDWELLKGELMSIDWDSCLGNSSVTSGFAHFSDLLLHKCKLSSPPRTKSSTKISKFRRHRRVLMRKRAKIRKTSMSSPLIQDIDSQSSVIKEGCQ